MPPANPPDLPYEVLQQVLASLDAEDLLSLGLVNHYFNHLALELFFGLKNGGTCLDRFPPTNTAFPKLVYCGLSMALGLQQITKIDQTISGGLDCALEHTRMLTLCIGRLRTVKIFILRIDVEDTLSRPHPQSGMAWTRRRMDELGAKFIGESHKLMDLVVSKGCKKLSYQGFHAPGCTFQPSQIRQLLCGQTVPFKAWQRIKSLVLNHEGKPSTAPSPESRPSSISDKRITSFERPKLKTCILGEVTFLGPSSISFNLDFLRRNAATITFLDLRIAHLTSDPLKTQGLVCCLLDNIDLPNLTRFTITTQVSFLPGTSLVWFFSRHPTLVGINFPSIPYPSGKPVMRSTKGQSICLPNLTELILPARVAAWLFSGMNKVPRSFQRVKLDACTSPDNTISLGNALRELMRRTERIDIFSLSADWPLSDWRLLRHHCNGSARPRSSTTPQLNIGKLILVGKWPPDVDSMVSLLTEILNHLMSYFASVETLMIEIGNCENFARMKRVLKASIQDAFPDIKLVGV